MVSYSAITDGEIDTDSALTTTLMRKYRDNVEAIRSGDQMAPRIESLALQFDRSIQRSVVSNAGDSPLLNIGLGDSRQQLIRLDVSWTRYCIGMGELASGYSVQCFGDQYLAQAGSGGGSITSGSSSVWLQGSNDLNAWANLQLVGSYSSTSVGGQDQAQIVAKQSVVWDGRGVSGKYSAAAYRYFRVFATGDSDHEIEGDFYLMAMGD